VDRNVTVDNKTEDLVDYMDYNVNTTLADIVEFVLKNGSTMIKLPVKPLVDLIVKEKIIPT
jgi:hypothetical protein